MRILNIMMGKGHGGLERAAIDVHEALQCSGCEVVSVIHKSSLIRGRFPKTGKTIALPNWGTWDLLTSFCLRQKIRNVRFDVVIVHGNRAAFLASRLGRIAPIVAVCHTTNYNILKCLNLIDGAITLTGHYRDVLRDAGYPPSRIRLVPNVVRLGGKPTDPPKRAVPVIGGLGRLVPNKGFDILLSACSKLKKRGVPFRCIIHGLDSAGSVASFEALRDEFNLSIEDVAFPGWTDEPLKFLSSLDVFCMPSRRETFSIALLEALAAGRPIICSKVPGLETAFKDTVEGLFVDVEDDVGLADALETLLGNRDLRIRMGRAARLRAAEFDINVVGPRLRNALNELSSQ